MPPSSSGLRNKFHSGRARWQARMIITIIIIIIEVPEVREILPSIVGQEVVAMVLQLALKAVT